MQGFKSRLEDRLRTWSATLAPFAGQLGNNGSVRLRRKLAIGALGLLYVCGVGYLDLGIARGLNFDVFYLAGCVVVGWTAGFLAFLPTAVGSGALLYADRATMDGDFQPAWLPDLDLGIRILAVVAAGLFSSVLGAGTRALQRALQEHSARITKESEQHRETSGLLQEAIELFHQVTENITAVFWVTNATRTKFEYVSPEFEKLWGESCGALYEAPKLWHERIHPDDRARVAMALPDQVRGHYEQEYRVVCADGSVRWVRDRAFPVQDEAGAVYRIVGIAEDITDRKRTQHLLETGRNLAFELSSTGELKYALERLINATGQLEGVDCAAVYLVQPETGQLRLESSRGFSDAFLARASQYAPESAEARLARSRRVLYLRGDEIPRNLEVFWGAQGLRAMLAVPLQHQGAALGMLTLGSFRSPEISEQTRVGMEIIGSQIAGAIARIQAEESLRRSEEHLRFIIQSAPLALLAIDRQGLITFEEGRALEAMGSRSGKNLGRLAQDLYRGFPLAAENIERALAGERFNSLLDFGTSTFECHYAPIGGKDGQLNGSVMVATDITERSRLERQILEISDREQARIGQDVHDGLCQELIGMALTANSLTRSLGSEQRAQLESAHKLCALIDEAITESRRVCRGLYPVRLNTEGLVPALEELARTVGERYKVECAVQTSSRRLRCIQATATHLYRLAQEAINNAVKHSGSPKIEVTVRESAGELELSVRDWGKGMRGAPGRLGGMGLHIMEYRARSIGGVLRVESAETGTVVTCRVPQLAQPAEAPEGIRALDEPTSSVPRWNL